MLTVIHDALDTARLSNRETVACEVKLLCDFALIETAEVVEVRGYGEQSKFFYMPRSKPFYDASEFE